MILRSCMKSLPTQKFGKCIPTKTAMNAMFLKISLKDVASTLLSRKKRISNRLSSPKVLLNIRMAKFTSPKVKSRLIYAGRVTCHLPLLPSLFPKIVQAVTLYPACANLRIKFCLKPIKPLVLM